MAPTMKHLPFFAVVEALARPGCALCQLVSAETRRYLDSLLYEAVNDAGFRTTWRNAGGFCHRHTWMLAESGDVLGLAILYLDLIQSCDENLLIGPAGRRCPVCDREAASVRGHLGTLVDFWDDAELQAALAKSEGLCGPHLRLALRTIRHKQIRQKLAKLSIKAMRQLVPDLQTLIQRFDYRHSPPADQRIRLAWRRVIERVVGHRDVPENRDLP